MQYLFLHTPIPLYRCLPGRKKRRRITPAPWYQKNLSCDIRIKDHFPAVRAKIRINRKGRQRHPGRCYSARPDQFVHKTGLRIPRLPCHFASSVTGQDSFLHLLPAVRAKRSIVYFHCFIPSQKTVRVFRPPRRGLRGPTAFQQALPAEACP